MEDDFEDFEGFDESVQQSPQGALNAEELRSRWQQWEPSPEMLDPDYIFRSEEELKRFADWDVARVRYN